MQRKKKEPVKIRVKDLAHGNKSLYLDIYHNGMRTYETLHLYLIPEKNRGDRAVNDQTWALAEAAKAKRVVEIQRGQLGFSVATSGQRFMDFYDSLLAEKEIEAKDVARGAKSWRNTRRFLSQYDRYGIKLADVDADWCRGFSRFLDSSRCQWDGRYEAVEAKVKERGLLSQNTKHLYLVILKAALAIAAKRGLIQKNPMAEIAITRARETERSFLTFEELQRMVETPYRNEALRRAFLFGCLTGLRVSDIMNLRWGDVSQYDGYTRITFSQIKTDEQMYLDINQQAAELMGERPADAAQRVFGDFKYYSYANTQLREWAEAAGVHKHLSFHSSRHTFAVLMLDLGTDLYTVSKLLGHKNITVTQIYAKVLDKNKRSAVDRIPELKR